MLALEIFINLPYNSGLFNISDRKAIRAQARQIAAQVLKVCEEEDRNEVLSVPLPQFKE